MLRTFVVGLGRAGAGLHAAVLARLRRDGVGGMDGMDGMDSSGGPVRPLFADGPLVVCDPRVASAVDLRDVLRRWNVSGWEPHGAVAAASVRHAARLLDPARTVVHLTTPPGDRLEILEQLAAAGFRMILVEKPLALDERSLDGIERLRRRARLRLTVVAHWLASSLTGRLHELVRGGALGELRSLAFLQCKPRFTRTLRAGNHPTAFDVEPPHSVPVALRLAGPARLTDAACTDMVVGDTVLRGLGGARLGLRHDSGVRTAIVSDLTSPVRRRRVVLRFDRGVAIGHYPGSADDDHAQLRVTGAGGATRSVRSVFQDDTVFPDDALATFLAGAYRRFLAADPADPADLADPGGEQRDWALHTAATRLLCAARRRAAGVPGSGISVPEVSVSGGEAC